MCPTLPWIEYAFELWKHHMRDITMEEIVESWNNAQSATPRTLRRELFHPPTEAPFAPTYVDIPPAPMDIVLVVPKLNIPCSAGASAAWAMEVSSAAAGTLRETGSQASAAPDPTFQNVQGIYTTEELAAEKRSSMIILWGGSSYQGHI